MQIQHLFDCNSLLSGGTKRAQALITLDRLVESRIEGEGQHSY